MKLYTLSIPALALTLAACAGLQNSIALQEYRITLADSSPADTTKTKVAASRDRQGRPARILSAFFGLDSALPELSNRTICEGAGGKDGMPVIFSHEIDGKTMQAGDFRVTRSSGKPGEVHCVTLAPADDPGEHRTALLVGEYGSADDQPVRVEIIGNLLAKDHSVNFQGASIVPIKLQQGPTMVLAEILPQEMWELDKQATPLRWGGGSGCPASARQVLRVVWAGGITKPGGAEADDAERKQYRVTVQQKDGGLRDLTPFALADLGDGDNNHKLCLDVTEPARSVFFPAGYVTDPREDLNPDSRIRVTN